MTSSVHGGSRLRKTCWQPFLRKNALNILVFLFLSCYLVICFEERKRKIVSKWNWSTTRHHHHRNVYEMRGEGDFQFCFLFSFLFLPVKNDTCSNVSHCPGLITAMAIIIIVAITIIWHLSFSFCTLHHIKTTC